MATADEVDTLCSCQAEVFMPCHATRKPNTGSTRSHSRPEDLKPLMSLGERLISLSIRPGESFKLTGHKTDSERQSIPDLIICMERVRSYHIDMNRRVHDIVTGENLWVRLRFEDSREYSEFYHRIQETNSILNIPTSNPELVNEPIPSGNSSQTSQSPVSQKPTRSKFHPDSMANSFLVGKEQQPLGSSGKVVKRNVDGALEVDLPVVPRYSILGRKPSKDVGFFSGGPTELEDSEETLRKVFDDPVTENASSRQYECLLPGHAARVEEENLSESGRNVSKLQAGRERSTGREEHREFQQSYRQAALTEASPPLSNRRLMENSGRFDDDVSYAMNGTIRSPRDHLEAMPQNSSEFYAKDPLNVMEDDTFSSYDLLQALIILEALRQKKNMERVREELHQHRNNSDDGRSIRDGILSAKRVREESKPKFLPIKSILQNDDLGHFSDNERRKLPLESGNTISKEDISLALNNMKLYHSMVDENEQRRLNDTKLGKTYSKGNYSNNQPDIIPTIKIDEFRLDRNGLLNEIEAKLQSHQMEDNSLQRTRGTLPRECRAVSRENCMRRTFESNQGQGRSSDKTKKIPVDSSLRPGQSTSNEVTMDGLMEPISRSDQLAMDGLMESISRSDQLSKKKVVTERPRDILPSPGLLLTTDDLSPNWATLREETSGQSTSSRLPLQRPAGSEQRCKRSGEGYERDIRMKRSEDYLEERSAQSTPLPMMRTKHFIPKPQLSEKPVVLGNRMERPPTAKKSAVSSRQVPSSSSTNLSSVGNILEKPKAKTLPNRAAIEYGGTSYWDYGNGSEKSKQAVFNHNENEAPSCSDDLQYECCAKNLDQIVFKFPRKLQAPSSQVKILTLSKPINDILGFQIEMTVEPERVTLQRTASPESTSSRCGSRGHPQLEDGGYIEPISQLSSDPAYYNNPLPAHAANSHHNRSRSPASNLPARTTNSRSKFPNQPINSKASFGNGSNEKSKASQTLSQPASWIGRSRTESGQDVCGRIGDGRTSVRSLSSSSDYMEIVDEDLERRPVQNFRRSGNSRTTTEQSRSTSGNTGNGSRNFSSSQGNPTLRSSENWECPLCHFYNSRDICSICSFRREKLSGADDMIEEALRVSNNQR